MKPIEYVAVLGVWVAYAGLAAFVCWNVLRITQGLAAWQRRAVVSLVLAVFFAPSAIGAGHGAGIGPAWVALFQMFPIKLGVLPILVTFVIFFAVGSIASWRRRRQSKI